MLAILGRLPWRWSVLRLAPVLLFVAVFAVPLIFFPDHSARVWAFGPATVSVSGAETALILLCKAAAIVLLAQVVLATRAARRHAQGGPRPARPRLTGPANAS